MNEGGGAQGGLWLYCEVAEYVGEISRPELITEKIPSIAPKGRAPFSPVLATRSFLTKFGDELLKGCNLTAVGCAVDILAILAKVRSGQINDIRTFLKDANGPYLHLQYDKDLNRKFFDILCGALQLICAAMHGSKEALQSANEDFVTLCGILSLFAENRQTDLMDHFDHFKAHAAIFVAACSVSQEWAALVDAAEDQMDLWGEPPPPEPVFLHAAHNFGLSAKGMPASDTAYEQVKSWRNLIHKEGVGRIAEAFEDLNRALGWNHAAPLLKLLWNKAYPDYYRYNKKLLEGLSDECERVGKAKEIGFVSADGAPLLRISPQATPADLPTVLSFPGGSAIGKTAVLCKIAGLRILLDFGCDMFGRTAQWSPDFDLLDAVFITHAHQDHIGGLLKLYKEFGYQGPWFAPAETKPMVDLSLRDAVKLRKAKLAGAPAAYEEFDVDRIMTHYRPLTFEHPVMLSRSVAITPYHAGHVHGSAQYVLSDGRHHLLYTGDYNTQPCYSCPPLKAPPPEVCAKITAVITEGTYAFKLTEGILDKSLARQSLLDTIHRASRKPVLIPTLSLGRAQEVIACLNGTGLRVGVFGMARDMTEKSQMPLDDRIVLDFSPPEKVMAMEYDVLVASAGCLQGGPSKVFFERPDFQPLTTILTGYLFPGTPAREMAEKLERVRFSAHSPHDQWESYLEVFPNARKYLMHYPGLHEWMTREDMVIPRINRCYPVTPYTLDSTP